MKAAGNLRGESHEERKTILLSLISNVPGIRYRELLKLSGFSNGVLFYHLTGLEQGGLVRVQRKLARKTTRYYPNNVSEIESAILSYLRHQPLKEIIRSEEHTSELQSRQYLVCRLLLEKKK